MPEDKEKDQPQTYRDQVREEKRFVRQLENMVAWRRKLEESNAWQAHSEGVDLHWEEDSDTTGGVWAEVDSNKANVLYSIFSGVLSGTYRVEGTGFGRFVGRVLGV